VDSGRISTSRSASHHGRLLGEWAMPAETFAGITAVSLAIPPLSRELLARWPRRNGHGHLRR
jgi:hypothetical protein